LLTVCGNRSIVSHHAGSKAAEFQTALLFAQEYGILAASLEDRPFVPAGSVVLRGAPRDLRAVFRKWDDGMEAGQQGGTEGEKVLGLSAALEALGA